MRHEDKGVEESLLAEDKGVEDSLFLEDKDVYRVRSLLLEDKGVKDSLLPEDSLLAEDKGVEGSLLPDKGVEDSLLYLRIRVCRTASCGVFSMASISYLSWLKPMPVLGG